MRSYVNNLLKTSGSLVDGLPHYQPARDAMSKISVDIHQVVPLFAHKLRTTYSHTQSVLLYLCEYSFYSVSTAPTIRSTTKELKGIL